MINIPADTMHLFATDEDGRALAGNPSVPPPSRPRWYTREDH